MNEGNGVTVLSAAADVINTIKDVLPLFLDTPAVYFTALAFVMAAAGVTRKFVPMKRR